MDILLLMQMDEAESDAYLVYKATAGLGTNELALIDVLAPRDPERIRACRDMYENNTSQYVLSPKVILELSH